MIQKPCNETSTMSSMKSKIMTHVKKQETATHNEEKNQVIKMDPKMIQMLELTDKDFKAATINVFKDLEENMVIMN